MIKNKCLQFAITLLLAVGLIGCTQSYHRESTGQYIDSTVITTKVKSKLLSDKFVKALPITVKTYKSTVQLSGFVDNQKQKDRAERIARSIEGVQAVDNTLTIKNN